MQPERRADLEGVSLMAQTIRMQAAQEAAVVRSAARESSLEIRRFKGIHKRPEKSLQRCKLRSNSEIPVEGADRNHCWAALQEHLGKANEVRGVQPCSIIPLHSVDV